MSLRMGVIGVGYLGQHHARIYAGLADTELVGVADSDIRRSEEIAETYGCKSFSNYSDLLPICDALSIVTPTTTHHAIARDCLKAGKDILIEKPITVTIGEAQDIIKEAEKNKLIVQVGHLERYNQALLAASDMIGEPRFIESDRLSPFLGRGTDVDVTLDLMIHDIDLVLSIVHSRLKDIRAIGESVLSEKIDVAKAWLEFENGCAALITASRLAPEKLRKLKIHQKNSFILIDYQKQEVRRYFKRGTEISFDVLSPDPKEPLKEELMDFVNCIKNRSKPQVSGIEGLNALEVAIRITELLRK